MLLLVIVQTSQAAEVGIRHLRVQHVGRVSGYCVRSGRGVVLPHRVGARSGKGGGASENKVESALNLP